MIYSQNLRTPFYWKIFRKTTMLTVRRLRFLLDNFATITDNLCSVRALYTCMATRKGKRRPIFFSLFSSTIFITSRKQLSQNFSVFILTIFQKWMSCCSSTFSIFRMVSADNILNGEFLRNFHTSWYSSLFCYVNNISSCLKTFTRRRCDTFFFQNS